MNRLAACLLACAFCWPVAAAAPVVPVRIGVHGHPDLDACLSTGEVMSRTRLRSAPDTRAGTSSRLAAGQWVFMCGSSDDGKWEGIVVPPADGADCGVTSPVDSPRDYTGRCASGWIPADRVRVVAG